MWDNPDLLLYHGTTVPAAAAIVRNGIDVRIGRATVDFGQGFYLTTNKSQATDWAMRQARRTGAPPGLMNFSVPREGLATSRTLVFVRGSSGAVDFWSFVRHCRGGGDHGCVGKHPWYDLVVGPVTRWPTEEARQDSDQVSVHTDRMAELFHRWLFCRPFENLVGP